MRRERFERLHQLEAQGVADLATRCARSTDALMAACRPGNTGADLYRAWESVGNPESPVPLVHGLRLGTEPPLIGLGRGSHTTLEEGMVLSAQSWIAEKRVGGCLERATVLIESAGPSALTSCGRLT
ncbi:MAG TPA: M24 family metallopeptidase [Mycobacterium sp.]|nr:M24 family metallopeptidase [Mycobacterium sp.]